MSNHNVTITCPVCNEGTLEVIAWDYPATQYDPRDAGAEVITQDCDCDMGTKENEDKLWDAVEKYYQEHEQELR